MAIFIAELGFAGQPEYLLMAKTGILAASLLSGAAGFVWLWQDCDPELRHFVEDVENRIRRLEKEME